MTARRRAVAFLSAGDVARALSLPDGMHVVAVGDDFLRNGVRVLVESDHLAPVDEGCEAPQLEVPMLDRSALALRTLVHGSGGDDSEVLCPVGCSWFWVAAGPVTLAQLADTVQQHLTEAHAGP